MSVGPNNIHLMYMEKQLYIYVAANLRNLLFPGIPNPLRESGESLYILEIPGNIWLRRFAATYIGIYINLI